MCDIVCRWIEMSWWGNCRGTCTRSRKWKSSQPWENLERRWGTLTAEMWCSFFPQAAGWFRGSCCWVHMNYLSCSALFQSCLSLGWQTSCYNRLRSLFRRSCNILNIIVWSELELTTNYFCFWLVWQLTAEDETFLTENATATLSQFEKVTANSGENKVTISLKCLIIQVIGWPVIFILFVFSFRLWRQNSGFS